MGHLLQLASDAAFEKPKKVDDVGEAFMNWAEEYWALRTTITAGATQGQGESCPYDYMRAAFVKKINELSRNQK